jgi:hypothetical protein
MYGLVLDIIEELTVLFITVMMDTESATNFLA